MRADLALSWLMGAAFLVWTITDFHDLTFRWTDNAYASVYWCTVGLHALHVLIGLVMNLAVQLRQRTRPSPAVLEAFEIYWHFVDAVWVLVFATLILGPHQAYLASSYRCPNLQRWP